MRKDLYSGWYSFSNETEKFVPIIRASEHYRASNPHKQRKPLKSQETLHRLTTKRITLSQCGYNFQVIR